MKKPELLAPAGNMESFYAAIEAGCDAVYLGGYTFGARNFAGNFSNEEIIEVIKYAHLYGVKVYVTVNTLVYENEVSMFLEYIDFLYKSNVDAVIMQDIGMIDLVRKTYPNLEIHASTQMHIHNLEGVKLCESLGLKRVVLARETPIEIVENIKENTSIELEIFVHGALCVCYSGQCLMSSLIGGRSGNRGTCAQTCRKAYDLVIKKENKLEQVSQENYLLSMKDLNTIEHIGELIEISVDSLKIEGRMKKPEYVYQVVSLYRKAIDNYIKYGKTMISDDDILELKKIFNRKFTKGYLFNELNNNITNSFRPNHMGIEIGKVIDYSNNKVKIKLTDEISQNDGIRIIGDKDFGCNLNKIYLNKKLVNSASSNDVIEFDCFEEIKKESIVVKTTDYLSLKKIQELLKNKTRKVLIDIDLIIKEDKPMLIKLNDGINEVIYQSSYIPEQAIKNKTEIDRMLNQIKKFGSTIYQLNNINYDIDDSLFVNIKEINDLRRSAVELLNEKRLYSTNYKKSNYTIELKDYEIINQKNIFVNSAELYNKIKSKNFDNIYVPEKIYDLVKDNNVILKLNRVINNYKEYNEKLLVGELGSIYRYKNVETDFSLNVTNSYAVAFLHAMGVSKITLSHELDFNQVKEIIDSYKVRYNKKPNVEVIVYGKVEAMITKLNLIKNYNIKDDCYLKDEFNNLYKLLSDDEFMYIYDYNIKKLDYEKYFDIGVNSVRFNIIDSNDLINLINEKEFGFK